MGTLCMNNIWINRKSWLYFPSMGIYWKSLSLLFICFASQ